MITAVRAGRVSALSAAGALALGALGTGAAAAAPGDAHDIDVSTLGAHTALSGQFVGAGDAIQIDGTCVGADPETDFLLVGALPSGADVNDPAVEFADVFGQGDSGFGGALIWNLAADGSFSGSAAVADVRGDYDLYAVCAFYTDTSWPYVSAPMTLLGESGVELSATTAKAGESVTVTGHGFAAGEQVEVVVAGGATSTATADQDGKVSATVTIPAGASGEVWITLTGAESALSVSAAVTAPSTAVAPTNTNGLPRAATDVLAGV